MASILLTGFEPFRNWPVNSSWEAVRRFGGPEIAIARLPVDHEAAAAAILALIAQHRPEALLMTGLAGGAALRLETVARSGVLSGRYGSGLRRGRWPFARAQDLLAARGQPAKLSRNAGAYVCETTYFAALGSRVPALAFLHVPPLGPIWTAERIARGIATTLEAL